MTDYQKLINKELASAEALSAKVEQEERAFSAEELTAYENHISEAKELAEQKKQMESMKAQADSFKQPEARKAVSAPSASSITEVKPAFLGDAKMGFKKHQDFFSAILKEQKNSYVKDERLQYLGAVGSDENQTQLNPYGGFLVPEGFIAGVMETSPEADPTMGRVTEIPMEATRISLNARVDKDHSTSVSGGLTVSRTVETGTPASSRQKFEQVSLNAHTLTGLNYTTNELLNDSSVSFASIVAQGFEQEFNSHIFNEKLNGSGTGEFEGVLNSDSFIEVAKDGGQTADTITFSNIINMYMRLYGKNNGVWLANHSVLPELTTIGDANTVKNIWTPSSVDGVPANLLGLPIFFTEYLPELGSANDIILCDWSQYLVGTYQPLQGASSVEVRFVENETAFRFSTRNDAKSWWKSVLTPKNGPTMSPFIGLAERA
jgi:HK97 family phage major capsid protein